MIARVEKILPLEVKMREKTVDGRKSGCAVMGIWFQASDGLLSLVDCIALTRPWITS